MQESTISGFTKMAVFLLALSFLFFLQGCDSHAEENATPFVRPVKASAIKSSELAREIHTSGLLSPRSEARLSFKIGGYVDHLLVDEGQQVSRGQTLASLKLAEIDAQVSQARSAREKAQRDLQRVENLYQDSVVTLENLQDARTGLEVATASFEIADFNRQHAKIIANTDGRILRRFVEEGELISPGMPVFLFRAENQDWVVRCGVGEKELLVLELGNKAAITLDAYPGQQFDGAISEIAEALDPRSATFEVEIRLDSVPQKIASGFTARVTVSASSRQACRLIPIEALVSADKNRGTIFLIDPQEQVARQSAVEVLEILENSIAIADQFDNGLLVVTEGAPYLRDGDPVSLVQQ